MSRRIVHSAMTAFFAGSVCFFVLLAQAVTVSRPSAFSRRTEPVSQNSDRSAASMELDPRQNTEWLIDAVILVESAGDPTCIGKAGERGLMQIKKATWRQVTKRLFGEQISFDDAFDPEMNRRVGRAYLAELQRFLQRHRHHWRSDERELLLGAYNAGPLRVQQAGFDVRRLPASTRCYIQRATALHEFYLGENAPAVRRLLMARSGSNSNRDG